jgi:undecaprenyl-diphosphatase
MTMGPNPGLPEPETAPKSPLVIETLTFLSLGVAVLSLFLFAWIAESVSHDRTVNFDLYVRTQIHQYASPGLTKAMIAISFVGGNGLAIPVFLSIVVFVWIRWRRAALYLAVTILGALVLDVTLKYAFHRARPTPFFVELPSTYSFPSGHALFSFCVYGVLAGLVMDRTRSRLARAVIWLSAAALIAAIGLSRIYLGVHYPSDVIAGYLAGTVWVSTLLFLDRMRMVRAGESRSRQAGNKDT